MLGLAQRVKEKAWGSAFVCTASVGNGSQNRPSAKRQVKKRVRTGVCVCVQRQGVQWEWMAALQLTYVVGQHRIYDVSICYPDRPFYSSS